jgi:hypothetical protein
MLLETSDIKKNDILIFSENKFDLENNFKIVDKKSPSKKPKNLSFYEIGQYINLPVPKSLIVYRLLTNHLSFSASITKYGFLLSVDGIVELVYFDPVFAIKDIELIKKNIDYNTFRFKIQQIGLSSLTKKGKYLDYSEIFAFDLNADEAKFQNDRVYAEAIFAFDVSFPSKDDDSLLSVPRVAHDKKSISSPLVITSESFVRAKINAQERMIIENKIMNEEVLEQNDSYIKKDSINRAERDKSDKSEEIKITGQNIDDIRKSQEIVATGSETVEKEKKQSSISDFLQKQRLSKKESKITSELTDSQNKFLNLFKSTSDLGNYLKERAKESFILKIEK